MPHFDEDGGDMWMCQAPNHRGNRVQRSKVESEWRPDITGHQSAGNCCPPCVAAHDNQRVIEQEPSQALKDEFFNPLDYVDNPHELEVQRELKRTGIRNAPEPTRCPECKGPLAAHRGMAEETVLVCPNHGIVWEDAEGAIRNVL